MKRPFLHTHTFIKRLADLVTYGKIAQISGKEIQTAEAWGRPVESNENPTGTGKRNPFDLVLRLIGIAHKEAPALAREMAELFPQYVDYLDHNEQRPTGRALNELIGESVKEHSEAVIALLNQTDPNFAGAHTEIKEAIIALERLDNYVLGEMREQPLKAVSKKQ